MVKPQVDPEDKDGCVQRLHSRNLTCIIWQGDMDHICQTGKEAQRLPPKKSLPHLGHILARQSDQRDKDLPRAGRPPVYTLLGQCQVHWIGHVHHMEDGHIPKDILSGELETGQRSISCL